MTLQIADGTSNLGGVRWGLGGYERFFIGERTSTLRDCGNQYNGIECDKPTTTNATMVIPPLAEWPSNLRQIILSHVHHSAAQ